jgi:hypothetical protein
MHFTVGQPLDCTWNLKVPSDLCTNITIIDMPTGDPFSDGAFKLQIRGYGDDILVINRKFVIFNILINSSATEVRFVINHIFEISTLLITFQVKDCDGIMTLNQLVTLDNHASSQENNSFILPDRIPLLYDSMQELFEYHVLVRGPIGECLRIYHSCGIGKKFDFHDGPSVTFPKLNGTCSNAKVKISASTFQMYMVYKHPFYASEFYRLEYDVPEFGCQIQTAKIYLDVDKVYEYAWDLRNSSKVTYKQILLRNRRSHNSQIKYYLLVSPTKNGKQGFFCQYGGVVVKTSNSFNYNFSTLGPVCTNEYAEMLNGVKVNSGYFRLSLILYNYGLLFSHFGRIIFETEFDGCRGIINPCTICDNEFNILVANLRYYSATDIVCKRENVQLFLLKGCLSYLVLPNEFFGTRDICSFELLINPLFNINLNLTLKSPTACQIPHCGVIISLLSDRSYSEIIPDSSNSLTTERFKETHNSYTISQAKVSMMFEYPLRSMLMTVINFNPTKKCQRMSVNQSMLHQVPEYFGDCFIFFIAPHVSYTFKVYLSRHFKIIHNFTNRFLVAASTTRHVHNHNESVNSAKVIIIDNNFNSNASWKFHFSSDQMPFVWTSYGQFLSGYVETDYIGLWLTLVAVYDPLVLKGIIEDSPVRVFKKCPVDGLYRTKAYDTCYTVHTEFSGDWNSASQFCEKQGGYLWSVNDKEEWLELLHTGINKVVTDADGKKYNELPINAGRHLKSSSLFYLGLQLNSSGVSEQASRFNNCKVFGDMMILVCECLYGLLYIEDVFSHRVKLQQSD